MVAVAVAVGVVVGVAVGVVVAVGVGVVVVVGVVVGVGVGVGVVVAVVVVVGVAVVVAVVLGKGKRFSMIYSKNKKDRLMGAGIAVRSHKPGPTGAQFPNSLFVKTDQTDFVQRMRLVRKRVLRRTFGA